MTGLGAELSVGEFNACVGTPITEFPMLLSGITFFVFQSGAGALPNVNGTPKALLALPLSGLP